MSRPRSLRSATVAALIPVVAAGLVACSGDSDDDGQSVFSIKPGQCFDAPAKIQAQLKSLRDVSCKEPHTHEAYAVVRYSAPKNATGDAASKGGYPGSEALTTFAQGACAQRYTAYVGVSYLDSKLFFTFLLPSVRSWESEHDRNVTCFVTTNGGTTTVPAKGSKR